jgi:hypothetical protein
MQRGNIQLCRRITARLRYFNLAKMGAGLTAKSREVECGCLADCQGGSENGAMTLTGYPVSVMV